MAVKIDGKMNLSVLPQTVFDENMTILVLAEKEGIQKCFRLQKSGYEMLIKDSEGGNLWNLFYVKKMWEKYDKHSE